MKILVDIGHPAHVHFFRNPVCNWQRQGHQVIITSRQKEIATDLLDAIGTDHIVLSSMNDGSPLGMVRELVTRDFRLLRLVIKERPDILLGIGGIYIAHAGFLTRTPSITFYDTENASLSNLITYPFTSLVAVPDCYQSWLPPWNLRYPGYHELSYLHPEEFVPDHDLAVRCGIDPQQDNFLLRIVSWQASHDLREKGWSSELLKSVVGYLADKGNVLISSERPLPESLQQYAYKGPPEALHHVMAYLRLFIGESATMASECAVLGVPAIYAAETGRGYTDEQETRYGLVTNVRKIEQDHLQGGIDRLLARTPSYYLEKREQLLEDKLNVSNFVTDLVVGYPDSKKRFSRQFQRGTSE